MRVFVTGATGYIGSVILLELLSAGHEVLDLDHSRAFSAAFAASGDSELRSSADRTHPTIAP